MFEQALKQIERFDRIIIHRHKNPDGDALGSQLGLKRILLATYPGKEVYAVGDTAKRYSFMDDCEPDVIDDFAYTGALAIILDTSARSLISDDRYSLAASTLRIDHHIFCETIAETEITDTSFESCCGMITAMALECAFSVPESAATALFTGMVTDSGRFRYDSTTSRTFRLASFLCATAPSAIGVYSQLYSEDFDAVKLRAMFTLKIRFTEENNVAYIYTDRDEIEELGADPHSLSRGMVGTMSDIRGVNIWVNFTEAEEGILCEIRSNKYNINPVAVSYGGGGHAKASGACVATYAEAMQLLSDLNDLAGT